MVYCLNLWTMDFQGRGLDNPYNLTSSSPEFNEEAEEKVEWERMEEIPEEHSEKRES